MKHPKMIVFDSYKDYIDSYYSSDIKIKEPYKNKLVHLSFVVSSQKYIIYNHVRISEERAQQIIEEQLAKEFLDLL